MFPQFRCFIIVLIFFLFKFTNIIALKKRDSLPLYFHVLLINLSPELISFFLIVLVVRDDFDEIIEGCFISVLARTFGDSAANKFFHENWMTSIFWAKVSRSHEGG